MAPNVYVSSVFGEPDTDGFAAEDPAYLPVGQEDAGKEGYWRGMEFSLVSMVDTTKVARENNAKGMTADSIYQSGALDVVLKEKGMPYHLPFLYTYDARLLYTDSPASKSDGGDDSTSRRARVFLPQWVVDKLRDAAKSIRPVDEVMPISNSVKREGGVIVSAYAREPLKVIVNTPSGDGDGTMEVDEFTLTGAFRDLGMDSDPNTGEPKYVDLRTDIVFSVALKFVGAAKMVRGTRQEVGSWKVALTPMRIVCTSAFEEAMAPRAGGNMGVSERSFRRGQIASGSLAEKLAALKLRSAVGGV